MKAALIIFAKRPVPGEVKTRLVPALGPEGASRLYEAFVRDLNQVASELPVDVRWYVAPGSDGFPAVTGTVHGQSEGSLGERMAHAIEQTRAEGYTTAVVIGTDSPTLGAETLLGAFGRLEKGAECVLGPAEDGGYYLLGLGATDVSFLKGVTYSRSDVLQKTLELLARDAVILELLEEGFDVDRPEDLERLSQELATRPGSAPNTRAELARWATAQGASL